LTRHRHWPDTDCWIVNRWIRLSC